MVGHMIDTERIMGYRAVCVARGETTSLPGFDENAYVANASFDQVPLGELLDEFAHVREGHLAFFRHLSPEAWLRKGLANGNPISTRALAYVMVGHPRHHLGCLSGSLPAPPEGLTRSAEPRARHRASAPRLRRR